jgi:hypothetical protein
MSTSPKYTTVSPSEARRQQEARERAERERRRREEEARRLAAERSAAQQAVRARLRGVVEQADRVRAEAVAVDSPLVADVDRACAALAAHERAISAAQDAQGVTAALREVERSRRALADLRARVLTPHRREAVARIDALDAMIAEFDLAERNESDRAGAGLVDQRRDEARRRVAIDPLGSTEQIDRLAAAVGSHVHNILARRAEQDELRQEAEASVEHLGRRLAALESEAAAVGVPFAARIDAQAALAEMAGLVGAGHHADARSRAARVAAAISAAESHLDSEIQGLAQRRDLMTSIVGALPDLGFAVDPASLEQTTDGALYLRAHRADGEELKVLVEEVEGNATIRYTTDAMLRAVDGAGDGTGVAEACDSLVGLIEKLGERTRRDGFTTGPVGWDPPRQARRLPGSNPTRRTRG